MLKSNFDKEFQAYDWRSNIQDRGALLSNPNLAWDENRWIIDGRLLVCGEKG